MATAQSEGLPKTPPTDFVRRLTVVVLPTTVERVVIITQKTEYVKNKFSAHIFGLPVITSHHAGQGRFCACLDPCAVW